MNDILRAALVAMVSIAGLDLLAAFVRTFFLKVKLPGKAPDPVSPEIERMYGEKLAEMIRVPAVAERGKKNPAPFLKLQAVMDGLFPLLSRTVEKKVFPAGSLAWRWPGKDPQARPLLLMAHQDVVPAPAEGWTHPPFSGDIENGEIFGRGTLDTKGTLFAFLQAAEELLTEGFVPETDIWFCSSCDEEIGGDGAPETVAWLQEKGVRPSLVLDEGGAIVEGALPTSKTPIALLGVLEKGYVDLLVRAKSRGGHSSTPPKNSPLARLARFIVFLEKRHPMRVKMVPEVENLFRTAAPSMSFGYRFLFGNLWLFRGLVTWLLPKINAYGRALMSTTIAFTRATGSDANNVIPSEATLTVNLRPHPIQDMDESIALLRKIAKKFDLEIDVIDARPSNPIVDSQTPAFEKLVGQIREYFPDVLVSPYVILGGTDCRHYAAISDAPVRFSPMRLNNADLKKMHGLNESVPLSALAETVGFYRKLIREAR